MSETLCFDVTATLTPETAHRFTHSAVKAFPVTEPSQYRGKFMPSLDAVVLIYDGKTAIGSRLKAQRLAKAFQVRCRRFVRAADRP